MSTRNGESNNGVNGILDAHNAVGDSMVVGQTSDGAAIQGALLRFTHCFAVFELYNCAVILRVSEALDDFKIMLRNRTIYSGRAIVRNLIDTGLTIICEIKVDESAWINVRDDSDCLRDDQLRDGFDNFIAEWQKLYKLLPEFKLVTADMQSFLLDMRLWLEQVELNVRSQPCGCGAQSQHHILDVLHESAFPSLGLLFERFEQVAAKVDEDLQPAHAVYAKRQLHPLVLCAPFMYRTFQKPLGYAGDYEMVNMMMRDGYEGGSVFAKVLNAFFLNTPPVVAHRNRITYLVAVLIREIARATGCGRKARVLNLGCGPALEVQKFLNESPLAARADFALLDFNNETIEHTTRTLNRIRRQRSADTNFRVIRKSVAQLLKEGFNSVSSHDRGGYDLIYCAGLFDYLTDPVCQRLLGLFYQLAAPGGLVLATNVDCRNPSRGWMEYVVDWYLCYRNSHEMKSLVPKEIPPSSVRITAEPTGVNIIVEIRKATNA